MIDVNTHACPQTRPRPAVATCQVGAIVQDDFFAAPHIDHEKCTECGVFAQVPDAAGVR